MRFVLAVLIVALDIWAVVALWQHTELMPLSSRVLWSLGVVIIPLVSFAAWFILSADRRARARRVG